MTSLGSVRGTIAATLLGLVLAACGGGGDAAADQDVPLAPPDTAHDDLLAPPDGGAGGCGATGRCGDGICCAEGGESPCACPQDCGWPGCGDGDCCASAGETSGTCAADCGATCGDGACNGGETHESCDADCPRGCGDGACTADESTCSCDADCGADTCGNGTCCENVGETVCSCPEDCGGGEGGCGDGTCCPSLGETTCTCSSDCGAETCDNGACCLDAGETPVSCNADCPSDCGDGFCSAGEDPTGCAEDCRPDCTTEGLCTDRDSACDCPREVAVLVGPAGGTVELGDARLTIPAGALAADQLLRVQRGTDAPPAGYTGYSPVFAFAPEGLAFAVPATVEFQFTGDGERATVFWSYADRPGYEWRSSAVVGDRVRATVTHFSEGFAGDGVQYSDPQVASCATARILEGRAVPPSGLALLFTVDDCFGNPLTTLTGADFVVKEDGTRLSAEAYRTILDAPGLTAFVTLSLDFSGSTAPLRPQLVAAARSFVEQLRARLSSRVLVAVEVFAGMPTSVVIQPPTPDLDDVLARLDELTTYEAPSTAFANLYGAVLDALQRSDDAQSAFRARNRGGAFTAGYVVVFTDGADTYNPGRLADVEAAEAESSTAVLGVALRSADYDAAADAALQRLAPGGTWEADDPAGLTRAFGALANRIAGQMQRTYLLGYCSTQRAGQPTVTIEVAGAAPVDEPPPGYQFDAGAFQDGCGEATFLGACAGKECGGLVCGACDDREKICAGSAQGGVAAVAGTPDTCVSFCILEDLCEGETFTNPLGYEQPCPARVSATRCETGCVDLRRDSEHCGDCQTVCADEAVGSACVAGDCACPGVDPGACDGVCVDFDSDEQRCGDCETACEYCDACIGGLCVAQECACGSTICPPLAGYAASSCNAQGHCEYANSNPTGWREWDVWIWVPAGSFPMGSPDGVGSSNEHPQHTVTFAQGFFLGKYEVTVAQYAACQAAGGCTAPDSGGNAADAEPRDKIDWQQAQDVCGFLGGRLPSEAEWEYAARGPDGRTYPWGENAPTCELAQFDECDPSGAVPVGSLPAGAAWSGALDMAGNLWEWVEDWIHSSYSGAPTDGSAWVSPSGPYRVRRGGGFDYGASGLRAADRAAAPQSYRDATVGARCLRDPVP